MTAQNRQNPEARGALVWILGALSGALAMVAVGYLSAATLGALGYAAIGLIPLVILLIPASAILGAVIAHRHSRSVALRALAASTVGLLISFVAFLQLA